MHTPPLFPFIETAIGLIALAVPLFVLLFAAASLCSRMTPSRRARLNQPGAGAH